MTSEIKTEAELAARVVDWLRLNGWSCWQEVAPWGGGGRVLDILARRGAAFLAVECKLTFGLPVIEQAVQWANKVHLVAVAVPLKCRTSVGKQALLRHFGMGRIVVFENDCHGKWAADWNEKPRLNRLARTAVLSEHLSRFHAETCAAGVQNGPRATPFKHTAALILAQAKEHPGIPLRELIMGIDHHWSRSSAYGSARSRIERGAVPGVRIEWDEAKKMWRVFPTDEVKP